MKRTVICFCEVTKSIATKVGMCVALMAVGILIVPTSSWADSFVVDQSHTTAPFQGYTLPGQLVGQEFVPTLASLDSVELQMNSQSSSLGSALINIRAGNIVGAILGTSNTLAMTNVGNPLQLYHFDFPGSVPLVPGNTHVIEVVHAAGGSVGVFLGGGLGLGTYAAGHAIAFGVQQIDDDLWFREGPVVPEPSTATLTALALVGLLAHRHRHRRVALQPYG